jgi:hypothetical protein
VRWVCLLCICGACAAPTGPDLARCTDMRGELLTVASGDSVVPVGEVLVTYCPPLTVGVLP